jgi:hypothetical protein
VFTTHLTNYCQQRIICDSGSFWIIDGSLARLPKVARLILGGINESMPRRTLVFFLLQHTHNTFKPSPPGFTPQFIIFAPVDSIANLLNLSGVLCSYSILFCRSNKIWKIITTKTNTLVTSVIETYQRCLYENQFVSCTTFKRATLDFSGVPSNSFIAFLFSDLDVRVPEGCKANSEHYGVQSRPTTAKICNITYYIATNSLRRRRRRSHRT